MKAQNILKRTAVIAVLLISQVSPNVMALTAEQKRLLDAGIYFFNSEGGLDCGQVNLTGSELPANVPEPHNALFSRAAARFNTNAQLLAAIYLTENVNQWRPFNHPWPASPVGASGPFQFMEATWQGYKTDGNNDGNLDKNNMYDAAYSAAKLIASYNARPKSPLGSLNQPLATNSLLQISASYNAGPGRVQQWGSTAPLSALYLETREYVQNVHSLVTSGFTKSGKPGYGDPSGQPGGGGIETVSDDCSSGVVAGNIVQTAINFSWPGPHEPKTEPKPQYKNAPPTRTGVGNCYGADCGVFVATVMHRSGADPNYPASGTSNQSAYVKSHPEKYDVLQLGPNHTTNDLEPGDILIVNAGGGEGSSGHTYIYIGKQPVSGYNQASASWSSNCGNSRMPSLGMAEINDSLDRGYYLRARLR